VSTVGRICAEARLYNQPLKFKKVMWRVGHPMMPHEESVSSAAVGFAIKVKAAAIVVFAFSGRATVCKILEAKNEVMLLLDHHWKQADLTRWINLYQDLYPMLSVQLMRL